MRSPRPEISTNRPAFDRKYESVKDGVRHESRWNARGNSRKTDLRNACISSHPANPANPVFVFSALRCLVAMSTRCRGLNEWGNGVCEQANHVARRGSSRARATGPVTAEVCGSSRSPVPGFVRIRLAALGTRRPRELSAALRTLRTRLERVPPMAAAVRRTDPPGMRSRDIPATGARDVGPSAAVAHGGIEWLGHGIAYG
jgi:hypothetical protein